jgi:hypothetical protein
VLGEYLDIVGGNAYYALTDHNLCTLAYDPHLPVCWALDFNVDPLCSVVCQVEEERDGLTGTVRKVVRVLAEIVLANSNTMEAAGAFIGWLDALKTDYQPKQVRIYGDASGNSRTTKSSRTDYELIREAFRRTEYAITMRTNTANPPVKDRVNTLNAALSNAAREHRLLIDPGCRELLKDLRQVRWARDAAGNVTGELDKSDSQRTHTSDALSYLVAQELGLRGRVGPRAQLL